MSQRIYRLARSGGIDTNPTTFSQRAGTFASAATEHGAATLLTRREPTGLNGYLILPEKSVNLNAALHLAQTVGARAEQTELPEDLGDVPVVGELTYRHSPALRETQAGIDPTELPRLLANTIPAGAWVAVTLRAPSGKERRHHTAWLSHRLGTAVPVHHSMSANAIVITVTAGGESKDEVRSLLHQVTAGLPGFDLDSDVVFPARRHRSVYGLALGALFAAGVIFGLPQIPYDLPAFLAPALFGVAAVLGAVGLAGLTGRLKSPETKLRNRLDRAEFPPPAVRRGRPRPPRKEQTLKGHNKVNGEKVPFEKHVAASDGDYPFAPKCFIVGANVVVGMVSPHAGAVSGETVTRSRATPPAMLQNIGPMIGSNEDGWAHLSAQELLFGTAVVGRPGSGKAEPLTSRFPVPVSDRFPTGWAANGDLRAGDLVYTPSGSTTIVADFSETFMGDVYQLTLSDGQKIKADAGHLWAVSDRTTRRREGAFMQSRMNDVDRRAAAEAARLRQLLPSVEPGTLATAADIERITGVESTVILRFLRRSGVEPTAISTTVLDGGKRIMNRPRVRFNTGQATLALAKVAADPRSKISTEQAAKVSEIPAPSVTPMEILTAMGNTEPTLVQASSMNATLKRHGVDRVRDSVTETLTARPTLRVQDAYPLREFISRYAEHIEHGRDRAPRISLLTTEQLAAKVRVSSEDAANWAIDLSSGIGGETISAPVDPYALGAWLGDGSSNSPAITCFDQPILDELSRSGVVLSPRKAPGLYGMIGMVASFRSLDVLNNKHIPASYLRASFAQRLALLQGLMDTDGTVGKQGACEIDLCDQRLAHDTLELIRSLGIKCSMTTGVAAYSLNGVRKVTGTRYRMKFTTSLPVFRLPRKLDRLPETTRPTQNLLYVISVEKVDPEPVRCIKVEAADGMYLTAGFVPTHNSLLTRSFFGWSCLERVRPSGRPGYPGSRNALIAFESKGDGVPKYLGWAHAMGDRTLLVDVGDASTPAIDMFAVPGDNAARASFFTNAMRYAFGDQAIGDRSFETLVGVLTAALSINDELLEMIDGRNDQFIPLGKSPIFYAHLLLGGHSDATGVELANGIKSVAVKLRARDTPNLELEAAYAAIASLYEGRTESARRSFLEAPRNKISQLLALDQWWSPSRRKITWDQVLTGHRSIIVNTGSPRNGMMLDDSSNQQMSSLLMYSLQNAIKRICSGWLEQGRSVSLFADELSLLAGSSPEVIGWLRDQGRSYGCRPFLATQRPEQLPALLRNNILTYATLISFAHNDPTTAREVAENVATGGDWTAEDIQHLEPFHVVVRSQVEQKRQSAFIVKLPNFEADVAGYPAAQGYEKVTA